MPKKHSPYCPKCNSEATVKKGTRRGRNRFHCKQCNHWFTVDHRKKDGLLWIPHIDGISFRKLGDKHNLSGKQACLRVFAELASLLDTTELTRTYCEYSSGILVIDGKYIKVRGYRQKIPFIYGIDYETHDIVFGILVSAEDTTAFLEFFHILKHINYPLQIVVADDRSSLPLALKQVYPRCSTATLSEPLPRKYPSGVASANRPHPSAFLPLAQEAHL